MSDFKGIADGQQDIKPAYTDGDSVQEGPSVAQEDSKAEVIFENHCKFDDVGETSGVDDAAGGDSTEASLDEMVEELTAEVEAFREATDDLETMSESVQCLLRTAVTGDMPRQMRHSERRQFITDISYQLVIAGNRKEFRVKGAKVYRKDGRNRL